MRGGTAALERVRALLPNGGELPADEWQRRHRGMVAFLWLNVAVLVLYSLVSREYGTVHSFEHLLALAPLALVASSGRLSRKARSVVVCLGLMTAAALSVHVSDGLLETHFYFFVLVVLLTLYEEWLVFLVAVGYVLLHHGIVGTIDPHGVYNHAGAWADPWKWAAVHAFYVALAGIASVAAWRLNENVRARMRAVQDELAVMTETDSLTGLGNRRKLVADLEAIVSEGPESVLVMLDLNGFKLYNDSFGHGAGDVLLARLGRRLERNLGSNAKAYRPGGDEFCVIGAASHDTAASLEALAVDALYEPGEMFTISASSGVALLPSESTSVSEAMRLADHRMYAQKQAGRPAASGQAESVLLQTLAERSPELGRHTNYVARLAESVCDELGLDEFARETVRQAAELHDIGKMAIPDAIVDKPGPLSDEEWEFIRRHTLIGERIVSAAPSLSHVGQLIRASHERFDGAGYPDGLIGEQIPIGARIIAVCDSFEAIVSDRPYRRGRSAEQALAEIERCTGTQFDPRVVAAFTRVLGSQPALSAGSARSRGDLG